MLELKHLQELQASDKNLLAFSAGGDSSALFFLLLEHKVSFDIAIVDYAQREQSKDEVLYAKELAKKYKLNCYTLKAQKISKNFESKAREIRYNFFSDIIKKHNYKNLITAHHLGDRFEWMLMQFCKGAGCIEIAGMDSLQTDKNYTLIRPLLDIDKIELVLYLRENSIKYFEDESNLDQSYKRNFFRHNYSNPLLKIYKDGIKKSFNYIDEDKNSLKSDIKVQKINDFAYFNSSNAKRADLYTLDNYLKRENTILSASERELLKSNKTVVVSRKIVVNQEHGYIFIAPYIKDVKLTKEFKEKMRMLKIEPKLRGYLSTDTKAVEFLSLLLE
jgi:tRNA(Ile)-lysidine synthase